MRDYHDREWGRPVTDEAGLYERLCLEAFQSGLSWSTILAKREGFRRAFAGVRSRGGCAVRRARRRAADGRRVDRPQPRQDRGGDRERGRGGRAAGGEGRSPGSCGRSRRQSRSRRRPATSRRSRPSRRRWRRRSRRTASASWGRRPRTRSMQACGLVNDHVAGCYVRAEVEAERRRPRRATRAAQSPEHDPRAIRHNS